MPVVITYTAPPSPVERIRRAIAFLEEPAQLSILADDRRTPAVRMTAAIVELRAALEVIDPPGAAPCPKCQARRLRSMMVQVDARTLRCIWCGFDRVSP